MLDCVSLIPSRPLRQSHKTSGLLVILTLGGGWSFKVSIGNTWVVSELVVTIANRSDQGYQELDSVKMQSLVHDSYPVFSFPASVTSDLCSVPEELNRDDVR